MSNYVMNVDFFGNDVRCETDGLMVSLTDLVKAGNQWRAQKGMQIKPLQSILDTVGFSEFKAVVESDLKCNVLRIDGSGNRKRTMAHITLAVYVAEQMSTEFHYQVIKTFIEGKILEFRDLGGTEFKSLNAAIDKYLPEREGKDNKGVYIQCAKILRTKILGETAVAGDWDSASTWQTHARFNAEKELVKFLQLGFIRNFEHLKEIIQKI